MGNWKLITYYVASAVVCSLVIGYGYSSKNNKVVINTSECVNKLDVVGPGNEADNYWDNTSMDDIRKSILAYVDDMISSTNLRLQDFKIDNNLDKIRLYENEIKRLNIISTNVRMARTKEELKKAIQVRHKDSL